MAATRRTASAGPRASCITLKSPTCCRTASAEGDTAAPKPRPVIYNSWEATEMNVTEAGQEALAEKAAALGVDRFVMDDGWFGQRKTDHAGLGRLVREPRRNFPTASSRSSTRCTRSAWTSACGSSRKWSIPTPISIASIPTGCSIFPAARAPSSAINLCSISPGPMCALTSTASSTNSSLKTTLLFSSGITTATGASRGGISFPPAEQKKVYVEFTRNLYSILAELQAKHPKVEIESCSGGGGRVDLGILQYADEVWPSDNTDPFDRLTQQDGFTYAYTPQIMMAWVTDSPHWPETSRTTSIAYRMLSSMQGSLGIGANIAKWSDEEMATAKRLIAAYHQVQPTIVQGDLYRLISPRNGSEFSATQTVNRDKSQSVVFAFIHSTQEGRLFPRLKLKGLDPAAEYALTPIEGKAAPATPTTASGAWWMSHGLDMADEFRGDFQAAAFRLDKK